MIGDPMDTDIVSGLEAGMETVLVLSGLTTRAEARRFPYRASRIVDSIADLIDDIAGQAAAPARPAVGCQSRASDSVRLGYDMCSCLVFANILHAHPRRLRTPRSKT